jgi:hypothetical protein
MTKVISGFAVMLSPLKPKFLTDITHKMKLEYCFIFKYFRPQRWKMKYTKQNEGISHYSLYENSVALRNGS